MDLYIHCPVKHCYHFTVTFIWPLIHHSRETGVNGEAKYIALYGTGAAKSVVTQSARYSHVTTLLYPIREVSPYMINIESFLLMRSRKFSAQIPDYVTVFSFHILSNSLLTNRPVNEPYGFYSLSELLKALLNVSRIISTLSCSASIWYYVRDSKSSRSQWKGQVT